MTTIERKDSAAAEPKRDTFKVHAANIGRLEIRIAALAKRATKLGGEVGMERLGTEIVERKTAYGTTVKQTLHVVRITGEAPKLNGWQFVATLQHAGELGNILRAVPGADLPAKYRTASPEWCDQCKAKRDRLESFIVKHDDGRMAQVGRQCLKDFLGHADPYGLASLATILAEAREISEDGGWGAGRDADQIDTAEYLAFVEATIKRFGWTPKSKADEWNKTPTASIASMEMQYALDPKNQQSMPKVDANGDYTVLDNRNRVEHHYMPTQAQAERAATALAWTRENLDAKVAKGANLSDYEFNLRIVASISHLTGKTLGIAASLLAYYDKQMEFAAINAGRQVSMEQAAKVSKHVGTVGERIEIKGAKTLRARELDGQYGVTTCYTIEDVDGNRYTWFSSNAALTVGETRDMVGTVKAHGEYQGVAQTTITRCIVEHTDGEIVDDLITAFVAGSASEIKGIDPKHAAPVIEDINKDASLWWGLNAKVSKSTKMVTLQKVNRVTGERV